MKNTGSAPLELMEAVVKYTDQSSNTWRPQRNSGSGGNKVGKETA